MNRSVLATCLCILMAAVAHGQSMPTGTITGTVTADRSALPGVTVTVASPSLQGTRSAVTTASGDYILPLLPPGRYTVTYELSGMEKMTRLVTLTVARTEHIDVDLKPTAIAESITVSADTPVTAVLENTTVSANYNQQEFFEKLPILRNLTNITLLAPGTSQNEGAFGIMISGSFSFDNLFMVNGSIVNENLRGQPHSLFIEDAIQETTIMTGAVPAEYGHFTGGVVNAITKSGGNNLSGSLRDNVTSESWNGKTPLTAEQSDSVDHTYEATLGGPMFRDRLWFFGAGRYLKTSDLAQTNLGRARTGDQDGAGNPIAVGTAFQETTFPQTDKTFRLEGKLTGTLNAKHTIIASYINVDRTLTNTSDANELDLSVVNAQETNPNKLLVVNYNGAMTPSFFVEGQYSKKDFSFLGYGARCYELLCGTRVSDRARGASYNSPVFRFQPAGEQRNHKQWSVKGEYFLSTGSLGSHDLKSGYENFYEVRNVNNWQGGSEYTLDIASTMIRGNQIFPQMFGGAGSTQTRINWQPIFVLTQGSEYTTDSVFLQDRWSLNSHWTINAGARWEKHDAMSGDKSFKIADDSAIVPRFSVHYDVFGNGHVVANAGYNRYSGRLSEGIGNDADAAGRTASLQWYYRGPNINTNTSTPTSQLIPTQEAMRMVFDWFFAQGGTNTTPTRSVSIPGIASVLDARGLRSPYVQEETVGLGLTVGRSGFVRADVVHRDWRDFYTAYTNLGTGTARDQFGNVYDKSIVGNSNEPKRTYLGLQTQFKWKPFAKVNFGGSYTWSKLRGDAAGENSGNGPITEVFAYPEYWQKSWFNPVGYLTFDQRHNLRTWGQYDFDSRIGRFNVSVLENFTSGYRTSSDDTIDIRPYVTNPGYQLPPQSVAYYFAGRGDLKHPDTTRTDLALNYSIRVGKTEIFFQPEIINLFNEQNVESYNEEIFTSLDAGKGLKAFNPFTERPIECPQSADAATCTSMGAHWQKGPSFGQPTAEGNYQQSRTVRFSIGARF
jgi:carboxypeptidase family protein